MSLFTVKGLNKNGGGGASGTLTPLTPESWVEIASREKPRKPGMTNWHMGTQEPYRIGLYQRYYTDGLYFDFWDGKQWLSRSEKGAPHWRQVGDYVAWRGLTRDGYAKEVRKFLKTFIKEIK